MALSLNLDLDEQSWQPILDEHDEHERGRTTIDLLQ
jgi:hypothetical protein